VLWHLWKERNRRIFENKICTLEGFLVQIKADVANVGLAFTVYDFLSFLFLFSVTSLGISMPCTVFPLLNAKGELLLVT
jgi:hypothetical protein